MKDIRKNKSILIQIARILLSASFCLIPYIRWIYVSILAMACSFASHPYFQEKMRERANS